MKHNEELETLLRNYRYHRMQEALLRKKLQNLHHKANQAKADAKYDRENSELGYNKACLWVM